MYRKHMMVVLLFFLGALRKYCAQLLISSTVSCAELQIPYYVFAGLHHPPSSCTMRCCDSGALFGVVAHYPHHLGW
jgi:hypothetical protein